MSRLDYEKNNTVVSLKNEIYGINQLLKILKDIKALDFSKLEGKIINVKLEKFIKEKTNTYVTLGFNYDNVNMLSVMIDDRYNQDTKSYVSYYDRLSINLGIDICISEVGKQSNRFNTEGTLKNINTEVEILEAILTELEEELKNIDSIVVEYEKIYNMMKDFSSKRSSFFKDNFKQSNGFY